ncbi:MAG: hypothetical protein EZS28_000139 [Streblomastix strix]|uniref:Uncharacterized protein n=1 Tax=Streblomastix strix TaxID=222440 RepID=A0A5J4XBY8_9EUKA|nr:MAG: hypothetical protein EZS28_000139 [Streblomastix strix]
MIAENDEARKVFETGGGVTSFLRSETKSVINEVMKNSKLAQYSSKRSYIDYSRVKVEGPIEKNCSFLIIMEDSTYICNQIGLFSKVFQVFRTTATEFIKEQYLAKDFLTIKVQQCNFCKTDGMMINKTKSVGEMATSEYKVLHNQNSNSSKRPQNIRTSELRARAQMRVYRARLILVKILCQIEKIMLKTKKINDQNHQDTRSGIGQSGYFEVGKLGSITRYTVKQNRKLS